MRYSANLNVIIKAIEKAASYMSRDFIELENLQTNPASAARFTNSCYNKVKQILTDDLSKIRPDFNLVFSDGQSLIRSKNAEYTFLIFPIDGINNLLRSNPDFTIAIALQHQDKTGKKETISAAIAKIYGNETYYCEKGFGAYLNNRRIRVSKRSKSENLVVSTEDQDFFKEEAFTKLGSKNFSQRTYGCRTLDVAYLSAARLEMALFKNQDLELLKPFLLLVREAGGKISEEEKFILARNS
jgi:myo-inositol-1(or 4)-monophosphatase